MKCAKDNRQPKPKIPKPQPAGKTYGRRLFTVLTRLRQIGYELRPIPVSLGGTRMYKDRTGRKIVVRTAILTNLRGSAGGRVYHYPGWQMNLRPRDARGKVDVIIGLYNKAATELLGIKRLSGKAAEARALSIPLHRLDYGLLHTLYGSKNLDKMAREYLPQRRAQ